MSIQYPRSEKDYQEMAILSRLRANKYLSYPQIRNKLCTPLFTVFSSTHRARLCKFPFPSRQLNHHHRQITFITGTKFRLGYGFGEAVKESESQKSIEGSGGTGTEYCPLSERIVDDSDSIDQSK